VKHPRDSSLRWRSVQNDSFWLKCVSPNKESKLNRHQTDALIDKAFPAVPYSENKHVVGARSLGMLRWRPPNGLDDRLLIVKITENNFQQFNQYPLHDETLAKILKKLEQYQPIAIGVDLFRDLPQGKGKEELIKVQQNSKRLIAVCKVPDENDKGIRSPTIMPKDRLGFVFLKEPHLFRIAGKQASL
jgi:hypothetical protein